MGQEGFDPFVDDDDDEDQGPTDTTKSKPFVELRKHSRSLEKQLREMTPELETLRVYKKERDEQERVDALKGVFTAIGLKEPLIKLYPGDADPSETAIRAWATEYELVPVGGTEGEKQDAGGPTGFTPVTTGAPAGSSSGKVSRLDWIAMQKAGDWEQAQRLFKEGRVDLSDVGR